MGSEIKDAKAVLRISSFYKNNTAFYTVKRFEINKKIVADDIAARNNTVGLQNPEKFIRITFLLSAY